MAAGERLGIFGGTFDPPHVGHLVVAAEVRWALGLDRVLLVVANDPWQKSGARSVSPPADRLALVEALVDGVVGVEASDVELRRGGPSYLVDTLTELRASLGPAELVVILGRDAAAGLPTWERPDELRAAARFVVVERPGAEAQALPEGWTFDHVPVPAVAVTSTELRARLADGRPIDGLVPAPVVSEIDRRGLYRGRRS